MPTDILDQLNPVQREAVLYSKGPELVVAGPGSGKTRVLTHKIAYLVKELGYNPSQILAVTFTNKAALEIKIRVSHLLNSSNLTGIWMGTFHGICARILRTHGKLIGVSSHYTIFDDNDSKSLIKSIMKELKMDPQKTSPASVSTNIASAKSELVDPASFSKYAYGPFLEKVAEIYPLYQKSLKEQNALDFDDLICKVVRLFRENADARAYYQNKFSFVLIDEYQDTNHAQYVFCKLITNPMGNICVVGDVSQSIYSFRGANFRNVLSFEKDFPTAKIFHLGKNYRSTKTIVKASKKLIENNQSHIKIDLDTDNNDGDKIYLFEAGNEEDEARFISDTVKEKLVKGAGYSDFAVLYRTNAQSRSIEEELIKEGIPYRLVGGVRFYDRKEIKDAVSYLRILHNPKDMVSWERIINVPPRKIGEKALETLKEKKFDVSYIAKNTTFPVTEMMDEAKKLKPVDLLDFVLEKSGYLKYLDDGTEEGEYRIENLKELRSVALKFESLQDFLENVSLVNPQDTATNGQKKLAENNVDAVNLMTLHQAKGLEFKSVFLVGLEEGLFPHARSLESEGDIEEERRLCYVGMTRAKEFLYLTYAKRRLYFGTTSYGVKSRFVEEIPEDLIFSDISTSLPNPALPRRFKRSVDEFLNFLEEERSKF